MKALHSRDNIIAIVIKAGVLGGADLKGDIVNSFCLDKRFAVIYLIFRNVRSGELRARMGKVYRQNRRAASEVEDFLTAFADSEHNQLIVHTFRVNIAVFCVIFRCKPEVELISAVDVIKLHSYPSTPLITPPILYGSSKPAICRCMVVMLSMFRPLPSISAAALLNEDTGCSAKVF